MSAITAEQAETILDAEELSPFMQGSLRDVRELQQACLDAGIPAAVTMEACAKPGCSPKAELLVRTQDADQVAQLFREKWAKSVESLGIDAKLPVLNAVAADGEPPCPACGTAAALVNGACSDCGLQLE